jgi:phage baseplate assembly protein W
MQGKYPVKRAFHSRVPTRLDSPIVGTISRLDMTRCLTCVLQRALPGGVLRRLYGLDLQRLIDPRFLPR